MIKLLTLFNSFRLYVICIAIHGRENNNKAEKKGNAAE